MHVYNYYIAKDGTFILYQLFFIMNQRERNKKEENSIKNVDKKNLKCTRVVKKFNPFKFFFP